jgi:DNA-directed RNA polymerase specialized sigma24 family protein
MSKRPPPKPTAQPDERSVLDLIVDIKQGATDPRLLPPQDRQACVVHLTAEGLSVPEIAQFLKRNDRTITRDRKAIQEAAALAHDPALAGRVAGQLVSEATLCIDRIRRVSRDRETPPAVKVDAERSCFTILSDLVQRLQSLGYLPTAAQRMDLTHSVGELPSVDSLEAELTRLKDFAQDAEGDVLPEVKQLEGTLAQVKLAAAIEHVATRMPEAHP